MSDLKIKSRVDELEQRYKLIAENLVDAIWVLDLETMRYDFITPSVTRLSGYTPEEYEQFRVLDHLRPDSAAVLLAALAEEKSLFDKGLSQRRTFEVEMIHKDGHPYWVEISSKLYRDEGGRIKIAGVSKDISRRKAAEKEREDLIQRLGLALAEKERLLKEVKVLRGLLPICAACKRIRDVDGRWWPLEGYIRAHSEAEMTHTICPDCADVLYEKDLGRTPA